MYDYVYVYVYVYVCMYIYIYIYIYIFIDEYMQVHIRRYSSIFVGWAYNYFNNLRLRSLFEANKTLDIYIYIYIYV